VDRWLPRGGTTLLLPTRYILPAAPREGIVVNIAEYRLYYYRKATKKQPASLVTYAVSAGREDWKTPNVETVVSRRLQNPAWYPPAAIRQEHAAAGRALPAVVPPGPDNPLGPLALKLGIAGGYFIHGTSKPFGIGMAVTHGCLRLYPPDMAALFEAVPENTKVRVINQPYKVGWKDGVLYVEAHPQPGDAPGALREYLEAALADRPDYEVDWGWVESVALQPRGVPVPVKPAPLTVDYGPLARDDFAYCEITFAATFGTRGRRAGWLRPPWSPLRWLSPSPHRPSPTPLQPSWRPCRRWPGRGWRPAAHRAPPFRRAAPPRWISRPTPSARRYRRWSRRRRVPVPRPRSGRPEPGCCTSCVTLLPVVTIARAIPCAGFFRHWSWAARR
jgi:L,D-transpeptidase ErfK/SrfK